MIAFAKPGAIAQPRKPSNQLRAVCGALSGMALAVNRQTPPQHVADAVTTHGRPAAGDRDGRLNY
jgi:hypothetical protein